MSKAVASHAGSSWPSTSHSLLSRRWHSTSYKFHLASTRIPHLTKRQSPYVLPHLHLPQNTSKHRCFWCRICGYALGEFL